MKSGRKHYLLVFLFLMSGITNKINAQEVDFIVDATGNGDFISVQKAINAVPDFRKNETKIFIKNGIYEEKLTLPATKTNVTLMGEDRFKTILTWNDYAQKKNVFDEEIGTSGSSSTFIFGEGFKAENITFENSSGPVGQAVAIRVDGDMAIFINCRFLGFQDTLYPHGEQSRQYYKNCYIEGTTDFIFGWSKAVFEDCEIYSKKGGQYITAASTIENASFGFVFYNCKLTGDAQDKSVYLGRPWRPFAKTVFIKCELGVHIRPEGWHNWNKPEAEKTCYYAEYESYGQGANKEARVTWSKQLDENDLNTYSLKKIFDGWIPNEHSSLNLN